MGKKEILASILVTVIGGTLVYWFTVGASKYLDTGDGNGAYVEEDVSRNGSEEWWVVNLRDRICERPPKLRDGTVLTPVKAMKSGCNILPGKAELIDQDIYILDCGDEVFVAFTKKFDSCYRAITMFD